MSVQARLARLQRQLRWRCIAIALLSWLPWIALLWVAGQRLAGAGIGIALALVASALLAWHATRESRKVDARWLIRRLDAGQRELQDSSDLLFVHTTGLGPLQQLQQARVQHRFLAANAPDLRTPFPLPTLLRGALAAGLMMVLVLIWPAPATAPATTTPATPPDVVAESAPQSVQLELEITPPAYTGLEVKRSDSQDAQIVQGSSVAWSLRFTHPPTAVRLQFLDGEQLPLTETDGSWRGQRQFEASTLYRIEADAAPLPTRPAARIDVRADRAPQLDVIAPERTLTVLDAAARHWSLAFDASDDYGLGRAELRLTLAQGSGEQVSVSERRIVLRGEGDARAQHFEHRIDLAALGYARGDDLIARIEVRDQRQPEPNVSRSASFILRWPPEPASDGSGVEGLVQKALPAYFRSQRQIIIDTEALLAQRAALDRDTFVTRSDTIGVDQRLLRLRYGQFLGEESEDAANAGEHDHDVAAGAEHDDDDDAPGDAFGDADALIAQAGHLHDIPEAATLLDPQTRILLRAALNEMWQAELQLRLGEPRQALPFEQRALDYIKRVQQSSRIYLARVGLELPQLDPARRLTGDAPSRGPRRDPLATSDAGHAPDRAWQQLQRGAPLALDDLLQWLRDSADQVEDALGLMGEIDTLRREPDCSDCRARLAARLWPLLTPPAAGVIARPRSDALGRAYLNATAPPEPTR